MQCHKSIYALHINDIRNAPDCFRHYCILQSVSERSRYYKIWKDFVDGVYTLCVTTEILEEYEEIISKKMSPLAAKIVLDAILRANNVLRVDAQYRFQLIKVDPDDNKFVDCAIVANAEFIVSDDSHFDVLEKIPFPKVYVKKIKDFFEEINV